MARVIEPSGFATACGGLMWLAHAAVRLLGPTYWAAHAPVDYASVVTFSLALFGLAPALVGLRAHQRGHSSRAISWGFRLALLTALLAGMGNLIEDGLGLGFIGLVLYLPASLLLPVGLLMFGITTIRAGVLPHWCGWMLVLAVVGLFFIDIGGGFVVGAACLVLAYFLQTTHPTKQPWSAT